MIIFWLNSHIAYTKGKKLRVLTEELKIQGWELVGSPIRIDPVGDLWIKLIENKSVTLPKGFNGVVFVAFRFGGGRFSDNTQLAVKVRKIKQSTSKEEGGRRKSNATRRTARTQ